MLLEHTPFWLYSVDSTVGLIENDASAVGRMLLQTGAKTPTSESEARGSGRDHTGSPLTATIAGLEPVNFITLATPHLGCRGNNHVSVIFQLRTCFSNLEILAS